jgi:hypothetical protein
MAHLFGRDWTRSELLKHVGDISQIARAKPYRLIEGHEDGVLGVDVSTGSGFAFSVLPSRGMDISTATWNGRPLNWRSATSDQHPAYFEPEGLGWLRGFYGGLVVTCGMTWAGAPCIDEGRPLGLHGRVSNSPATAVHWDGVWDGDDYIVSVSGKVREAIVFGENVQLSRRIWARMGEDRLFIEDTVENMGYLTTPHMFLYHINIGFPAIGENARLISPTLRAVPRDEEARRGAESFARMQYPTPLYSEKCYFHELQPKQDGTVTTALVNPDCDNGEGFGVYTTFRKSELPYFTQWKMMGEGTFVCGMEPANALVLGRDVERSSGRLQHLEPGERRTYHVEIGVVHGREQIEALEAMNRV